MKFPAVFILAFAILNACNGNNQGQGEPIVTPPESIPPVIGYSIIKTYPHDTSYFTEGLEFFNDQLLESSGGDTDASPYPSAAGIANLQTGKVDTRILLDRAIYFGEGITVFNNQLYMLTWKNRKVFVHDALTFKRIKEFQTPTEEAWGLTHDSTNLIMSNGSNSLHFLNPETLQVTNIVGVIDNNGPVSNINELEYVNGFIYANQWLTPFILKIDAKSGKVVGRINMDSINQEITNKYPASREMNGIAFNAKSQTFFITGKKWPFIYEIKLQ
ncbi:MAG: glutaminyl-peptide cyclotransferase [Chitinophagaceae bacterium]|nr:glutaminyl-peptide cyclotransferase [Chitinophagaceae bacterium]